MDYVDTELEGGTEPIYYSVRRAHDAHLTQPPFTQNPGHPRDCGLRVDS